jgi:predicted GNAT superfamily acetyltransferase
VPDRDEAALAAGLDLTVGASIAYWGAGRQQPTRTIYAPAAALGAVDVEIPSFASRLHVAADVTPLAVVAEFRSQGGLVLATYVAADFAAGASVPVPNGAIEVRLTAGAAPSVFAAIFSLAL